MKPNGFWQNQFTSAAILDIFYGPNSLFLSENMHFFCGLAGTNQLQLERIPLNCNSNFLDWMPKILFVRNEVKISVRTPGVQTWVFWACGQRPRLQYHQAAGRVLGLTQPGISHEMPSGRSSDLSWQLGQCRAPGGRAAQQDREP